MKIITKKDPRRRITLNLPSSTVELLDEVAVAAGHGNRSMAAADMLDKALQETDFLEAAEQTHMERLRRFRDLKKRRKRKGDDPI